MKNQTIKTYKNLLDGKYVRSESNVTKPILLNEISYNVVSSTRKDLRNSVQSNRRALSGFSKSTALLRTQIIYRVAENLEGRKTEFLELLKECKNSGRIKNESPKSKKERNEVESEFNLAINLLISLAGWPDKYSQLLSSVNPVSGDFFNTTVVEPVGVILAYLGKSEEPLVDAIRKSVLPLISGNTVTLVVSPEYGPLIQSFGEVLNTSDVPAGAVNILSGEESIVVENGGKHYDIDLIEVSTLREGEKEAIKTFSSESNLKKVVELKNELNTLALINLFVEYKSIWQTIGY